MSNELSKTYDPAAVEAETSRVWLEEKCFAADPAKDGPAYCIVIPPPNVTGALHLGHAINDTLQDILTRVHRMRGFNTLWIPGIDHAGIATQAVVEKQLKEKENQTRHDIGREQLVRRIWAWKEQYGSRIIEQLKRLGCSCDWDRTRFTLDDMCARAVRETFFKLFKDGLIYRGKRLVNWDVHLQTSISDDEIYHETVKTSLWHIRYPIIEERDLTTEGTEHTENTKNNLLNEFSVLSVSSVVNNPPNSHPKYMTVATTRPETMLGDTAVAVHSEDPRWNWAIGKFVELPLTGRKIPIIADDILVDPKFGSGVVKVTPGHDYNDNAVWQRHLGKPDEIDIIDLLNEDGTINDFGGPYKGMKRETARKKVVEDLTAQGLLEKEEPYETQVGHSDRSKSPIEPCRSNQWFVKMAPLAEPALEVVRNGTIKFYPERHAQQYLAWLGEKRDWPVSRQLWWGHRIPVWHMPLSGMVSGRTNESHSEARMLHEQECGDQIKEFLKRCGFAPTDFRLLRHDELVNGHREYFVCIRNSRGDEAMQGLRSLLKPPSGSDIATLHAHQQNVERFRSQFGVDAINAADTLRNTGQILDVWQDEDVLDTWFSSALWPHSTLGWPDQTPELKKYYPTAVLVTGRDIITLWVARMVMMGMYNMGTEKAQRHEGTEARSEEIHSPSTADSSPSCLRASVPPCLPETSVPSCLSLGIPFHHVAINPTILDGRGERMSKSKGNGVDPVEIIDTHGADALRFTLTQMATETQDVRLPVKKNAQGRNTSDKFDIGRNFASKLWNAAKFAITNLESISPTPLEPENLSLAEAWIVSRFNRAIAEANTALAAYRFDQYAKICYDFFWNDFCDWYVEAVKPSLKDVAHASSAAAVLSSVLDGALRLMHPMIPFITEKIWWRLNEVCPARGLSGQIDCPPSQRLILASWPSAGPINESAEATFAKVQEIVRAIRNARNEYQIDPRTLLKVYVDPADDQMLRHRGLIHLLANCEINDRKALTEPDAPRISVAGYELWITGLINKDIEKQRSEKQIEELTRKIATLKGRLENAGYIAKAPPHLVDETKKQLAEAEAELAKLKRE